MKAQRRREFRLLVHRARWESLRRERELAGPISIGCSRCKAPAGSPCITPKARQATLIHSTREHEFRRFLYDVASVCENGRFLMDEPFLTQEERDGLLEAIAPGEIPRNVDQIFDRLADLKLSANLWELVTSGQLQVSLEDGELVYERRD